MDARRILPSRRNLAYPVIAAVAFAFGSASVAAAGPVVSGFVGLIDGNNTAAINATRELSVADAGTRAALAPQPFTANLSNCAPLCGGPNAMVNFLVPAGRRAVVEFVSASVNGPQGTTGVLFAITGNSGGAYGSFPVGAVYGTDVSGVGNTTSDFSVSKLVRIYADPGTIITVGAFRSMDGFVNLRAQISGYYVPVP